MRPDWLIIGELYTPAALTAVQILGQGHCGLTTTYARRGCETKHLGGRELMLDAKAQGC